LTKEVAVAAMRALRLDSASIVVRAITCASRRIDLLHYVCMGVCECVCACKHVNV